MDGMNIVERMLKRAFDIAASFCGLVLLSPAFLYVYFRLKRQGDGPVIFRQERIGLGGRPFDILKFRTMRMDAEQDGVPQLAERADDRLTPVGKFLREHHLDELPQLWNVITGDMSLVGPRPIVQAEVERYHENIREYYLVRPGITGMWQASGRSDTTYEERVAMDTWYVRNWSVWIDLVYLFKTFKAVFVGKGAY